MRVQFISLSGSHDLNVAENTTVGNLGEYVRIPAENLEYRVRGVEVFADTILHDGDVVVATKKAKAGR